MVLLWYLMISTENHYGTKTTTYGVYLMISREKDYGAIVVLDYIYRNYYDTKTTMVYT